METALRCPVFRSTQKTKLLSLVGIASSPSPLSTPTPSVSPSSITSKIAHYNIRLRALSPHLHVLFDRPQPSRSQTLSTPPSSSLFSSSSSASPSPFRSPMTPTLTRLRSAPPSPSPSIAHAFKFLSHIPPQSHSPVRLSFLPSSPLASPSRASSQMKRGMLALVESDETDEGEQGREVENMAKELGVRVERVEKIQLGLLHC